MNGLAELQQIFCSKRHQIDNILNSRLICHQQKYSCSREFDKKCSKLFKSLLTMIEAYVDNSILFCVLTN